MQCPECHSENPDDSSVCAECSASLTQVEQYLRLVSEIETIDTPTTQLVRERAVVSEKYQIRGELGRGGMGVVYTAGGLKLKRPVALEFLPPDLRSSAK